MGATANSIMARRSSEHRREKGVGLPFSHLQRMKVSSLISLLFHILKCTLMRIGEARQLDSHIEIVVIQLR